MIPKKEIVWLGVVESESAYLQHTQPWETGHGFNMQAARALATNTPNLVGLKPEELLAPAQCGLVLDFMEIEEAESKLAADFVVTCPGTGHGMLVWFDAVLTGEIAFSNAPGCCYQSIYQQTFFPWTAPVCLETGDVVRVKMRCNPAADDYFFSWSTEVLVQGRKADVKARFDQSDFSSFPVSTASLRKWAETFVPRCNGDASVDTFILKAMDGQVSVGEIASRLAQFFPDKFQFRSQALDRVARISQAYSE